MACYAATCTYSIEEEGGWISSPFSRRLWRCSSMASRMSRKTSSLVSPTAMHPGRSGTCAPKEVTPCSITTAYFIPFILLQPGLFEDYSESSSWHLDTWFPCHRHGARLYRMSELAMASSCSNQCPAILPQKSQEVSHLHLAVLARTTAYRYRLSDRKAVSQSRPAQDCITSELTGAL